MVTTPAPKPALTQPKKDSKPSKTEKRLLELKQLYDKGIITEQEYKKTRARILSEI